MQFIADTNVLIHQGCKMLTQNTLSQQQCDVGTVCAITQLCNLKVYKERNSAEEIKTYMKMAEQILNSSRITSLNWDINKNLISIKSFKTFYIKKDKSELKVEFLDENRRRCQLSLNHFYHLCDLRNSISQIALLLNGAIQ